jgi:DNA polymerase III gamma/tau subunit
MRTSHYPPSPQYLELADEYGIYILDEVHMLTKEAFNALLKTLEEPPKHVIFILATTEFSKIPDTIVSRCQTHTLQLMDSESMSKRLRDIVLSENRQLDDLSYKLIMRESGFSMRDSLSILEKILIAYPEGEITSDKVEISLGLISGDLLNDFYRSYIAKDLKLMLDFIDICWDKGYSISKLFIGLGDKIRENLDPNNIYVSIEHISKIHSILNEFRTEPNKRAVGYVIVNNIVVKDQQAISKDLENISKTVEETKLNDISKDSNLNSNNVDSKLDRSENEIKDRDIKGDKELKVKKKTKEEGIKAKKEDNNIEKERENIEKTSSKDSTNISKTTNDTKSNVLFQNAHSKANDIDSTLDKSKDGDIYEYDKEDRIKERVNNSKITFELVRESWDKILKVIKDRKLSLMIFLTSSQLEKVDDNSIIISYDREHTFHKESISKKENLMVIEDIFSKFFCVNLSIKIVYSESDIKKSSNLNINMFSLDFIDK